MTLDVVVDRLKKSFEEVPRSDKNKIKEILNKLKKYRIKMSEKQKALKDKVKGYEEVKKSTKEKLTNLNKNKEKICNIINNLKDGGTSKLALDLDACNFKIKNTTRELKDIKYTEETLNALIIDLERAVDLTDYMISACNMNLDRLEILNIDCLDIEHTNNDEDICINIENLSWSRKRKVKKLLKKMQIELDALYLYTGTHTTLMLTGKDKSKTITWRIESNSNSGRVDLCKTSGYGGHDTYRVVENYKLTTAFRRRYYIPLNIFVGNVDNFIHRLKLKYMENNEKGMTESLEKRFEEAIKLSEQLKKAAQGD